MNRLYMQDKISIDTLQKLTQKIVGNENCNFAEAKYFAEKDLIRVVMKMERIVLG
jgi:hypothetical protein